jgi:hypothetical protein
MANAVKWLIEKDVFLDGNPERMVDIIRGRGMECRTIRYSETLPLRGFPDGENVIVYGSMGFVRDMVRSGRWRTMAWFDEEILSCHHYYGRWPEFVLQKSYRFLPLGEVHRQHAQLYAEVGTDGQLFVRPDDNLKSFAGKVVEQGKFEHWYQQNVRCYDLKPSLLCMVARPQEIFGEWRVIIAQRKVLTASAYVGESRSGTVEPVPVEVLVLAGKIAANGAFDPLPIYVMDLARTVDGLFLMEIGSMNCASMYNCDLEKIIDAATRLGGEVGPTAKTDAPQP